MPLLDELRSAQRSMHRASAAMLCGEAAAALEAKDAEIKELRAALDDTGYPLGEIDALRAEIKELKTDVNVLSVELTRVRAEISKLRAALDQLLNDKKTSYSVRAIRARKALAHEQRATEDKK
jgi:predicted nuclease with TOPRIM domain